MASPSVMAAKESDHRTCGFCDSALAFDADQPMLVSNDGQASACLSCIQWAAPQMEDIALANRLEKEMACAGRSGGGHV